MPPVLLNDFLIGCDPEFIGLSQQGNLINFKNHHIEHNGPVGWDHDGWVAEIRPEPAKGTYALLKRIQRMILNLPHFNGVAKLRAGARYINPAANEDRHSVTLGGHVHLNLNPFTPQTKQFSAAHLNRVAALDRVTQYYEALDILPSVESRQRRQGQYGHYGDVRPKGDAFNPRFEYRTMASWLFDPEVAYLCLTGAKLAAVDPEGTTETLNNPATASFTRLRNWFERYKKDTNAKRLLEKLALNKKFAPPDTEMRESWERLPC